MAELGRTIALIGGVMFLLGMACQTILIVGFYGEKSQGGYFAYSAFMLMNPGAFFTYVFKELEPGGWRKRLVIPWLSLTLLGLALVVIGAVLDPTS